MSIQNTLSQEDMMHSIENQPPKLASASHTGFKVDDPDSPLNFSLGKKIYTSFASFLAVFTILYATTTLSAAVPTLPNALMTSQHKANLAFSMPFFGVFFAPTFTPHLSEKFGRKPVYLVSYFLFCIFVLGGGFAKTINQVLVIRFFAGLCGGPNVVLIEGTFADIWTAEKTISYYVWLALSQYWGAAWGPIIGGYILRNKSVAWLSWVTLFFGATSLVLLVFMPETYNRKILRQRLKNDPLQHPLAPALSGTTTKEMAKVTIVNPLIMLVSEPLVTMIAFVLGLNFALVFQWFVSVPAVLSTVYGFSTQRTGLAFLSAVIGAVVAAATGMVSERLATGGTGGMAKIETRMYPAMVGCVLTFTSLFWVGWTTGPGFHFVTPIAGTGVFVWGNMSILFSLVSYLFDAYPPRGTLSALTACACFRLLCAGLVPIFILDMITDLTSGWAFSTFGFIAAAMLPIPFIIYFFGERLRTRSRYSQGTMAPIEPQMMEVQHDS